MRSFLKIFLAVFLSIILCGFLLIFFFAGLAGSTMSKKTATTGDNAVLTIDLSKAYVEQPRKAFPTTFDLSALEESPGLYDVISLIKQAKTDEKVKGIYLIANTNANGAASSEEIRNAINDFKTSKKLVLAFGDVMTEKAYSIANVADKVYVSPTGMFEWNGYSVSYLFLKGALDKLEIKPQIFYAGKFKSATEPLRLDKMSDANKLQTSEWMNDLYTDLLQKTATARNADTAALHRLANEGTIRTPQDAVTHHLIDGAKYDDEIKDELKKYLKIGADDRINFVTVEKYFTTATPATTTSEDKIALIYATGNIVDGKGEEGMIGSTAYIDLLRKARLDKSVKAIVVRVNSGGGSALASENILREMLLAKKAKPLMVSFGDVAASGGYYISCAADSIYALPNTITGSIGVFGVIPDMSTFFKNKLGVTFDAVTTGPLANGLGVNRPMAAAEKIIIQDAIDRIYTQFKDRVATGRKKDTAYVENIAQGRVWSGLKAKEIGLVDVYGGLQNAIDAAAKKAKISSYKLVQFPKQLSFIERLLGMNKEDKVASQIKAEMGMPYYKLYEQVKQVQATANTAQARLPFEWILE